jgi:CRISPR-associated protein Cmr4
MSANTRIAGGFLGLHAQTSLHPGAGTALEAIDLPVQRERHTQWPTIPGTAIKGVLRDEARHATNESDLREADKDPDLVAAFGPDRDNADKHAGALSFTDARLLAFPVRSLKGVFAWTSCPAVLTRLQRDAALVGVGTSWTVPAVQGNTALVTKESVVTASDRVVLEEYDFAKGNDDVTAIASWIAQNLLAGSKEYASTRERFQRAFVLLSDDDFTYFARHATEVTARIALDAATKTVKKGALFYQELLPAETLFYSVVIANASRSRNGKTVSDMKKYVEDKLPPVIQIGGDETTGKGLCATRLCW